MSKKVHDTHTRVPLNVIRLVALVDTFHDFAKHPLVVEDVSKACDAEITDLNNAFLGHQPFDFKRRDCENALHEWLVQYGYLRPTQETVVPYTSVMEQRYSPIFYKSIADTPIQLGRMGVKGASQPTMLFADVEEKQRTYFISLVADILNPGAAKSVKPFVSPTFVIDRTLVDETLYCKTSHAVAWGVPSEYDHLVAYEAKSKSLSVAAAPDAPKVSCVDNKRDARVILARDHGVLLELVNATTTTDKGWFYTRPEVGSIGTIDVPLILKQKTLLIASSRVPTGLTLFAQCIHALKKRKKTKREAPSIAVDVERDSKRRRQAGGGKHAMEDVLEMKVEQILHQQFGLEPPGNTPAAQRSYIRACFDFKRMMDFGQVELAVGLPQPTVFVTHDRVASYYARLKGLPVLLHKPMGKDTMDADDAEAQTHRNKGIVVFPSALDTYQLTDGEMDAAVRQWTDDLGAPLQRWQPKTALEGATVFKERLLAYTKEWKTDATSLQTHSGMLRWWNVFCLAIAWVKYVYTWSSVAATGSLPPQTNNVQKAFEAWQTWLQKHGRMQRWQWRGDETGPDWAQWSADLEKYTQATAIDLITWLETFAWKDTENEHVWMSMKFLAFQVEDMKTQHTSRGVKNVMPDTMALVYDYIEDGTLYANQALYQAMTWTQNNKELQGLYETTKGIKAALANFTMPKYKVKAVRRKKEQSGGLGQAPVWASFAAAATQKMAGQEMASWMSKTKELHWKSQQMALVSKTTKTLASQPISTHPKTLLHTDSYIQFSRKRWWKHASSPPTLWEHIVGVWRQDESPKTIRMPRHVFYGLNLLLQVYEGAFEQS